VSLLSLLADTCTIRRRTLVTSGMTDTETFADAGTARCRLLKNSATLFNAEKAQHATAIKTRFVLPVDTIVAIRDRILHEGRAYEVVEVIAPFNTRQKHHKIAVCEIVAGDA